MTIPKQYMRDRMVLLIGSVNVFLTFLLVVLILLRQDTGHNSYIVQYRSNATIDAYKTGSSVVFLSFVIFALMVLVFHTAISLRVYLIHRQLAVTVLGLGTLLLVLAIIVSNSLLFLR